MANEAKDGTQSMQKAVLVSGPTREGKNTARDRIVFKYKRIDVEKPYEREVNKFTNNYSKEELALLKALGDGEEFCLVTEKKGQYWNLKEVLPVTAYKPKEKKPWNKDNKSRSGGGYDSLGNQVGNCVTNAVASLGAGKTMEEYKQRARELLVMGDELRAWAESRTKEEPKSTIDNLLNDDPPFDADIIKDDFDDIEF